MINDTTRARLIEFLTLIQPEAQSAINYLQQSKDVEACFALNNIINTVELITLTKDKNK